MSTPIIGLRQRLLAQANVTAITSNIYSIPAPPDLSLYPLITYQQVSVNSDYCLSGPVGIDESRIVYNCFGNSYAQARQLASAVRNTFDGFQGVLPDGTPAYTQVITQDDGYDSGNRVSRASIHIYVYA